ncbi:hypothetical protein PMIN01_05358 [Paraphaeosphaeria minitans]|uniref:Uncharacterized protein n=1 Tax=Paraphaeosphaeria minitans TaxID=565426 RepID=A0A9P6GLF8_9PLEO|nr:hypothetical protein PMIN01_05358 [Paraphaeosphaeria minitans]
MSAKLAYVLTVLLASANFDLCHIHGVKAEGPFPGTEINIWQLQNDNPTCDQVKQLAGWHLGPTSSSSRCTSPTNPLYHFTIYKDRGYAAGDGGWRWYLYGTDGKSYGECFAWGNYNWDCKWPDKNLAGKGYRKFRCLTNVGANTISDAFKKEGGKILAEIGNGNETAVEWKA